MNWKAFDNLSEATKFEKAHAAQRYLAENTSDVSVVPRKLQHVRSAFPHARLVTEIDNSEATVSVKKGSDVVVLGEYKRAQAPNTNPVLLGEKPKPAFFAAPTRLELKFPLQQISLFSTFEDDWDGYGSKAPSKLVLELSEKLLMAWDLDLGIIPDLSVLSEGDISFELYSECGSLLGVVDVFDDGVMSYALSIDGVANETGSLVIENSEDRKKIFELILKAKNSV
ncbi:hypothetical protein [Aliiroseovarius crassostreae]|uniref:hypothetical protein n=1 Tax=Aliiroseovarius crassostreae TaxID=154981 RepID=UPI002201B3A4|nr:hypothetical protein [Aliiroseovarius crassostreae]UWP89105.1 hypothetical protein K3J57_14860 [Aliiroseovarius crassostreae]